MLFLTWLKETYKVLQYINFSFCTHFQKSWAQRRNEEEHNYPGGESLRGAEKFQQCRKYFLHYSTFPSKKPYRFEHGGAKLVSCPGRYLNLSTPLHGLKMTVLANTRFGPRFSFSPHFEKHNCSLPRFCVTHSSWRSLSNGCMFFMQ